MEFVNLHVSVFDDEKLATAEPMQRSTWLHLLRHCVGQENGGRIKNCREWSERKWLLMARVLIAEVQTASQLWTWDENDLVVWGYPQRQEKEVRAKRSAARSANAKRWAPQSLSESLSDSQSDSLSAPASESIRKGKERKGKNNTAVRVCESLSDSEKVRFLEVGKLIGRRSTTPWSAKEVAALKAIGLLGCVEEEFAAQVAAMAAYYDAPIGWLREHWGKDGVDFRRRELLTLLNNWPGELDRAHRFAEWLAKKREDDARATMGAEVAT